MSDASNEPSDGRGEEDARDRLPIAAADALRSIRAMIEAAPPDAVADVARALQARLNRPAEAAARRVAELGLLASCLDGVLQDPDRSPRVKAETYDARRAAIAPEAPTAETLARHYGSWKHACYAAYGLRIDGSKDAPGKAWPTGIAGRNSGRPYTREECIASIRLCEEAIGRRPSSHAYARWRSHRLARARANGEQLRLAPMRRILALLAPRRKERDGWRIALKKALG